MKKALAMCLCLLSVGIIGCAVDDSTSVDDVIGETTDETVIEENKETNETDASKENSVASDDIKYIVDNTYKNDDENQIIKFRYYIDESGEAVAIIEYSIIKDGQFDDDVYDALLYITYSLFKYGVNESELDRLNFIGQIGETEDGSRIIIVFGNVSESTYSVFGTDSLGNHVEGYPDWFLAIDKADDETIKAYFEQLAEKMEWTIKKIKEITEEISVLSKAAHIDD